MLPDRSSVFYIPYIHFILVQKMTSNRGYPAQQIALPTLPQALCSLFLRSVLRLPSIIGKGRREINLCNSQGTADLGFGSLIFLKHLKIITQNAKVCCRWFRRPQTALSFGTGTTMGAGSHKHPDANSMTPNTNAGYMESDLGG